MRKQDIDFVERELALEPTTFHYFDGREALLLLALRVGAGGSSVAALKRGPNARWLQRPVVQRCLERLQGRRVTAGDLLGHWEGLAGPSWTSRARLLPYHLSFGRWGSADVQDREWHQMSRAGWNLVLRLNFTSQHDREFRRRLRPELWWNAGRTLHPIDPDRFTLAWTRIDVDLETREALIEEIQSDWVRDVRECEEAKARGEVRGSRSWRGCAQSARLEDLRDYRRRTLAPHMRVWARAALTATVARLVRRFRIHTLWHHTPDTGVAMKGIWWGDPPPRSLYTDLPRRFGFEVTDEIPEWVFTHSRGKQRYHLARRNPRFHVLRLDPEHVEECAPLLV